MSRLTQLDLFSVMTSKPSALPEGGRWRTVSTPHQPIEYVLQRSRRRSIGFVVDDIGLRVRAPAWVTLAKIDAAVIARSRWILEKLEQRDKRLQHLAVADSLWKHYGHIPYMGIHIAFELQPSQKTITFDGALDAPKKGDTLALALPDDVSHQRIQDSVHAWLQQQARRWFNQRLDHFLAISGQSLHGWRLSSATTRWGSCSSAGRIMLNWRLIHFRHDIIDYVIAHEVAHLREMNHSKAFWQELQRLMPDFAPAKNELRRHRPGTLPLI